MQIDKINPNRVLFNKHVTLFKIFFQTNNNVTAMYVCNYSDASNLAIEFDGNHYDPYPVSLGNIAEGIIDTNGSTLTFSNVGGKFRPILPNVTELIKGEVVVYEILYDALYPEKKEKIEYLTANKVPIVLRERKYHISKILNYNSTKVEFSLKSYKDTNLMIPTKDISSECIYDFKDINCKYCGDETVCNKSYQRCKELNNTINFGGFFGRDKF